MLSTKWTAVSFVALSALAGATVVFGGCTVTSGKVDDVEGGAGNADTGTTDANSDAGGNACPGNKKQTIVIGSAACQAAAEKACCAELTTCFDLAGGTTDAGVTGLDCNKFFDCTDKCNGGDAGDRVACQKDCDDATSTPVQTAYDAIAACLTKNTDTNAKCQ